MSWLIMFLLSVVQGVTEFLPVSSSGHLFLLEKIFHVPGDLLFFNVMLHFASALAIVIALWSDVKKIFSSWRTIFIIGIATIPGVLGGLLIKDVVESWGQSYLGLGIGFGITAVLMLIIDRIAGGKKYEQLSWGSALVVGLFQLLALMPGISRSGSTMLGGKIMKLDKENAVRFSFLLAWPIVMGAGVYELLDVYQAGQLGAENLGLTIVGFLICLVVSWLTIHFFLKFLRDIPLKYFGYYVGGLALLVLIYNFYR